MLIVAGLLTGQATGADIGVSAPDSIEPLDVDTKKKLKIDI